MQKIEVLIDIAPDDAKGESLQTAVTVVLPDRVDEPTRPIAFFAWPGGGYNRHYFDLQLPGRSGYSQAEHHAANGFIFVACDHPGIGDSTVPAGAFSHADTGRVNAATARAVLERLRNGTLDRGVRSLPDLLAIGMGQSYGGLLLAHLQGEHPTFDGVAMLGWSSICTVVKASTGEVAPPARQLSPEMLAALSHPYRRSFHYDDVPEDIVAEDLLGYPFRHGVPVPAWATPFMPGGPNAAPERGPLGPNVVVDQAAAITVPVLIANGEIDTCEDPRLEPTAYRSSMDVTTVVIPRSSHMHNFAGTREVLWRRLEGWARSIG